LSFWVYILASGRHGTLYVGSTGDLARRIGQHRAGAVPGFTKTYGVTRLVYYERYDSVLEARGRERALKRWRRDWKTSMIEDLNPDWSDLTGTLI
jgi:putative endonuclease